MHPQEMLFHVIGAIERFVTYVAVERLLLAVDVLVSGVEITAIGSVRAIRTRVTLSARRY